MADRGSTGGHAIILSTSTVNSAAMLILQQVRVPAADADAGAAPADGLMAAANGIPLSGNAGASKPSRQAQAKVVEALFSANTVDANKLKIKLMERLGKQFGLSVEEFDTQASFAAAVRDAVGQIKQQENGYLQLIAIEKELGLDKLGITLDELVNALIEPETEDGRKLEAALRKQAGDAEDGNGTEASLRALLALMHHDGDGVYQS